MPPENSVTGDPVPAKKKEGRLGVILTALGCLIFLVWWFRPEAATWQARTPADYVQEALLEPAGTEMESWLSDLDLLEIAVLQGGMLMQEQGIAVARQIRHPRIQARALRQIAQQTLASDSRMGTAPEICDSIADPGLREIMKEEVLAELALLGYGDSVISRAGSPRMQAALAASLAQGGEVEKAMPALHAAIAGEASVAPDDRAAWAENIALARIRTVVQKGSTVAEAAAAIRSLPAERQRELWMDLFRTVFGAGGEGSGEASKVLEVIDDPALRRELELESVQSQSPLRPGAEFLEEARRALDAATGPSAKAAAMLALADTCVRVSPFTDATPELEQATKVLQEAKAVILALPEPAERARLLLSLAEGQTRVTLAAETQGAIAAALTAIGAVTDPAVRLDLAASAAIQAFHSGLAAESARAARIAADVLNSDSSAASQRVLARLSDYHLRSGDWRAAVSCVQIAPVSARNTMLDHLARLAAEQAMGYSPTDPPPRGPELDAIRDLAISDEREAAGRARNLQPGPARARGLLAVAKGLLLPPGLPPNISGEAIPPGDEELYIPEEPGNAPAAGSLPEESPKQ